VCKPAGVGVDVGVLGGRRQAVWQRVSRCVAVWQRSPVQFRSTQLCVDVFLFFPFYRLLSFFIFSFRYSSDSHIFIFHIFLLSCFQNDQA
jgi:hypothetical protein